MAQKVIIKPKADVEFTQKAQKKGGKKRRYKSLMKDSSPISVYVKIRDTLNAPWVKAQREARSPSPIANDDSTSKIVEQDKHL